LHIVYYNTQDFLKSLNRKKKRLSVNFIVVDFLIIMSCLSYIVDCGPNYNIIAISEISSRIDTNSINSIKRYYIYYYLLAIYKYAYIYVGYIKRN